MATAFNPKPGDVILQMVDPRGSFVQVAIPKSAFKALGFNAAGAPAAIDTAAGGSIGAMMVPMQLFGGAEVDLLFGYFVAPGPCKLNGVQIFAGDPPDGADITCDVVLNGVEQSAISTLADGATKQSTDLGTPLTLAAGDIVQLKVKTVGSTSAGGLLNCNLVIGPVSS